MRQFLRLSSLVTFAFVLSNGMPESVITYEVVNNTQENINISFRTEPSEPLRINSLASMAILYIGDSMTDNNHDEVIGEEVPVDITELNITNLAGVTSNREWSNPMYWNCFQIEDELIKCTYNVFDIDFE